MYTRIRKSPFFYAHQRHGVQSYTVTNRQYHPRHYDDPIAEYWKLVNDVTMWDVAAERQVEITGPDAFALTNMLTPRDLTKCAVTQCKFVLNTDVDGRSEEHTSELQSRQYLVCRLLLEKKKI